MLLLPPTTRVSEVLKDVASAFTQSSRRLLPSDGQITPLRLPSDMPWLPQQILMHSSWRSVTPMR